MYYIDKFVEFVCFNLLWGNVLINGVGVLKEEMRRLNFIIIEVVDKVWVLVGGVLVVDRYDFLGYIIEIFKNYENIIVINEEINVILDGYIIIVIGLFIIEIFV